MKVAPRRNEEQGKTIPKRTETRAKVTHRGAIFCIVILLIAAFVVFAVGVSQSSWMQQLFPAATTQDDNTMQNDTVIGQLTTPKTCDTDEDCGLLICSGCFSNDYIAQAPPDLACRRYEGYTCACMENRCTEVL